MGLYSKFKLCPSVFSLIVDLLDSFSCGSASESCSLKPFAHFLFMVTCTEMLIGFESHSVKSIEGQTSLYRQEVNSFTEIVQVIIENPSVFHQDLLSYMRSSSSCYFSHHNTSVS